jgi:hypothetical protein
MAFLECSVTFCLFAGNFLKCVHTNRRFVDEALAADFMSAFKKCLERPEFMNLGAIQPEVVRKDRKSSTGM